MGSAVGLRGLVATALVIALLGAATVIVCTGGGHVPLRGTYAGACPASPHSAVLGGSIASDAGRNGLLASAATARGPAPVSPMAWLPVALTPGSTPGAPSDPLHGRLRL